MIAGSRALYAKAGNIIEYNLEGITLRLGYVDLEFLKPHERYSEERVEAILGSLKRRGYMLRPLIVDIKTGTLIDGTHRLEALRRLKALRAPVTLIDYINEDEVKVDRWIKIYKCKPESLEGMVKLLESRIPGSLFRKGGLIVYKVDESLGSKAYRLLEAIEGFESSESRIGIPWRADNSIAIIPPRLSKEDVVKAAVEGSLFPPKATRHLTILKRIILRVKLDNLLRS